jgi:hypothetical protein
MPLTDVSVHELERNGEIVSVEHSHGRIQNVRVSRSRDEKLMT